MAARNDCGDSGADGVKNIVKKGGRLYGRDMVVMNGKTYYTDKQIRMYRHAMTMRNHSVWQGNAHQIH